MIVGLLVGAVLGAIIMMGVLYNTCPYDCEHCDNYRDKERYNFRP